VALVFGCLLALPRQLARDTDSGGLVGLAASPADRGALFLGLWLAGLAGALCIAAVLLPAAVVFLGLPAAALPGLAAIAVLGLLGWQAAATLIGSLAATARAREVLLPVLLLPALLPVLLAAVEASAQLLAGAGPAALAPPLILLASYAVVLVVLGFLLYPFILETTA
jgi:heme exporter protein B